ncbi:Ig-like domain-containing protein [Erysipelothrix sp. HDW6C]|uniref:Ig-like domain-containing protein n=1 Tax=Erysipelothrix sp. HDW6C TaxID=2714930 RepID=UPI00140E0BA4|nr:Ig-like domain-containing protein [Erysipelothrix sp. HDW6C]QIK70367.1 Ig-like domain-containing protein [Erysipelothrix sp. HDW6C]
MKNLIILGISAGLFIFPFGNRPLISTPPIHMAEEGTEDPELPTDPIKVTQTNLTLEVLSSTQIVYSIENNLEATVTFASSNPAVATVDAVGMVSAIAPGTAVITITAVISGKTFTKNITITVPSLEGSVSFKYNELQLHRGSAHQLEYTLSNANLAEKDIIWNSSDPSVVSIENGQITGNSIGTATISATIGDQTSSIVVNVIVPLEQLEFNPSTLSVIEGETIEIPGLIYVPYDATGKRDALYSIEDASIVDFIDGQLHAVKVGSTRVFATIDGVVAVLDITVTPKQSETGGEIIELVVKGETGSSLIYGVSNTPESTNKRYALVLPVEKTNNALAENKEIIIALPELFLKDDMKMLDSLKINKEILETIQDKPLSVRVTNDKQKDQYRLTMIHSFDKDVDLKLRLNKLSPTSQLSTLIDGRAFTLRMNTKAFPEGTTLSLHASLLDSLPSQMQFFYKVNQDGTLDKVSQDIMVSDDDFVTFNVESDNYVITFNKISNSNDNLIIWVLLGVGVIALGGVGLFSLKRKNKEKSVL